MSYNNQTVNVIFEDYTVTHTDGVTYTRVRCKHNYIWIPIKLLPKNVKYDEIYPIERSTLYYYSGLRH